MWIIENEINTPKLDVAMSYMIELAELFDRALDEFEVAFVLHVAQPIQGFIRDLLLKVS